MITKRAPTVPLNGPNVSPIIYSRNIGQNVTIFTYMDALLTYTTIYVPYVHGLVIGQQTFHHPSPGNNPVPYRWMW